MVHPAMFTEMGTTSMWAEVAGSIGGVVVFVLAKCTVQAVHIARDDQITNW